MNRVSLIVAAFVVAGLSLSVAHAQPATSPTPTPASNSAPPQPIPFSKVLNSPLLWPSEVTIDRDLSDGTNDIPAGTTLSINSLDAGGVVISMPIDNGLMMIDPSWTDVGMRAAQIAQALPEDMRNLTRADLAKRDDLFPERIATTTIIDFTGGASVPVGTEFVPGRIVATGNGATMFGINATIPESGPVQRTYFDISYTDFIDRVRDTVLNHPERVGTRFTHALQGNLVNAQGEPVEPRPTTEYYLVYHGAGWCGWCRKLMPDLQKFYDDLGADADRVEVIYVSEDKSKDEMYAYMRESNMKWPALDFDKREATAPIIAMTDGGTPHVLLVAADGRILHQGEPIGGSGAKAAMQTLKQELKKPRK